MKSFEKRLIELLQKNIQDNFYFKSTEDDILELIDYLEKNVLSNNYEDNEEIQKYLENPNKYYYENL